MMIFYARFNSLERVGTVQNTIPESITQMMQLNWNVMVSSRIRKHVSRSMMIRAKNIIMKERTRITRVAQRDVTNVDRSGEWFNMESRNLVPGDLVKLTLGLIPADCAGRLDTPT